ncbi:MAG: rhodanese-like domain-containing protein [Campylobacterota bacterium]|nr:rhodanese-like domain-containing protein [Campylobacterota bacterium]
MKKLIGAVLLSGMFLSSMLFGSDIKLIEPADAIRLIGDKRVIFVSGEDNNSYSNSHIIGSVSMPVEDLYSSDEIGNIRCISPYNCLGEIRKYLQSRGVGGSQMIIAYDNTQGDKAADIYAFFERLGHVNLRVLNGGASGIKALDPNQQVFDKLQAEQEAVENQALEADSAGNADEHRELEVQAENIEAKLNLLRPQLLVRSDKDKKRKVSEYPIDIKKINSDDINEKEEILQ